MKRFFLSLDLEDWYHLEYFQVYHPSKDQSMLNELSPFFELLNRFNIKITVFVLGELIESHQDLIQYIHNQGHEIAIHGWNHNLLTSKTTEEFIREIEKTKETLESFLQKPVIGYRAPCFSLNNEKLDKLSSIGMVYDSSYIDFSRHPLYGKLTLDQFVKVEDLIYQKDLNFFEFELPTISLFAKSIPISGGGYFRFFPRRVFNMLWKKYQRTHHNFVMYIHPFELTDKKIDLKGFAAKDIFRFSIGRKNNLKKLEWFIQDALQSGFQFETMEHYIRTLKLERKTNQLVPNVNVAIKDQTA